jgi:peptidoglycan hydrolase-like protein with peptidoglycan-binding domain
VSLLVSTNQLGQNGTTSSGAFPSAPQSAGRSSNASGGGAQPNSGRGGSSNPPLKSASINPGQHDGLDWLVLALLAAAALMALWFIVARRQADPETAAAAPHPAPKRLRRASWAAEGLRQGASSFAAAVGLVALSDAAVHHRRRRAAAGSSAPARRQHQPAAAGPAQTDANGAAQGTVTATGVLAEPAPAQVPAEPSPERTERVRALQRQLSQLGLEAGPADGHYGPITTAAVERFQRAEALPVDGVVGPLTADRLRASASGAPAPERTEQVKALQRQLSWLGFEPGTVDGRYGPITTGAVKRFQEANDLTVDGVVGHGTRDALRASLAQRPSSDRIERVKGLQRQLSRLGHEPGPVDGRYGPLTTAAVARFQESHELPADGVVDPATNTALQHSVMNSESR